MTTTQGIPANLSVRALDIRFLESPHLGWSRHTQGIPTNVRIRALVIGFLLTAWCWVILGESVRSVWQVVT